MRTIVHASLALLLVCATGSAQPELCWERSDAYPIRTAFGWFTPEGECWALGLKNGNLPNDAGLVRLDQDGSVLHAAGVYNSRFNTLCQAVPTVVGGALIAGTREVSQGYRGQLIKLDRSGTIQWTVTDTEPTNWSEFTTAAELHDGTYLVGGSDFYAETCWLRSYSRDGELLIQTDLDADAVGLILTLDDGSLLLFLLHVRDATTYDVEIQRRDGGVLWSTPLSLSHGLERHALSAGVRPDGLLAVYYSTTQFVPSDIILLDLDGNEVDVLSVPELNEKGMLILPDNGFLLLGSLAEPTNVYNAIKLDAFGVEEWRYELPPNQDASYALLTAAGLSDDDRLYVAGTHGIFELSGWVFESYQFRTAPIFDLPLVSLALHTAESYPEVPATGGTTDFTTTLTNNTAAQFNGYLRLQVTHPGWQAPGVFTTAIDIPANDVLTINEPDPILQPDDPDGIYTFTALVADSGGEVLDSSSYRYYKGTIDDWVTGSIDTRLPARGSVSVYPNPFNALATVRFTLPIPQTVTVDVIDLTGRRVSRLDAGARPAGTSTLTLDASSLPSGIYLLRVSSDQQAQLAARKLVVVK